jgi:hypothetical protein
LDIKAQPDLWTFVFPSFSLNTLDALLNNTKYAKQKGTLKDDLIKFLNKMNPPKDLSTAYPSDVRMFLVFKEKDGKTKSID